VDVLEQMIATVVEGRHLPAHEVRDWEWARLQRVYDQVALLRYERDVADMQKQEHALGRVLQQLFGGQQPAPYPSYADVRAQTSPSDGDTSGDSDAMRMVHAFFANNPEFTPTA